MRKRHWFFWLEKALQRPTSLYGFSWEPSRRERGRRSRRGVRGVWIEGERRSGGIRKNKSTHQRDPISCRFLSLPPPPPLPKTCRFCDGHVFFSITRVSPVIWLKAAGNGRNSTRDRNKWHCFRPRGERERSPGLGHYCGRRRPSLSGRDGDINFRTLGGRGDQRQWMAVRQEEDCLHQNM